MDKNCEEPVNTLAHKKASKKDEEYSWDAITRYHCELNERL